MLSVAVGRSVDGINLLAIRDAARTVPGRRQRGQVCIEPGLTLADSTFLVCRLRARHRSLNTWGIHLTGPEAVGDDDVTATDRGLPGRSQLRWHAERARRERIASGRVGRTVRTAGQLQGRSSDPHYFDLSSTSRIAGHLARVSAGEASQIVDSG